MSYTNITVRSEVYERLKSLKRQGQSFSDIIWEGIKPRPTTCGELLDALERDCEGVQLLDPERIKLVREGRGRRSNRKPLPPHVPGH